jgi:hypothetical protein
MIIMSMERTNEDDFAVAVEHNNEVFAFGIHVVHDDGIEAFQWRDLPKPCADHFHHSMESRDFREYFWRFYHGERFPFPIVLEEWADQATKKRR